MRHRRRKPAGLIEIELVRGRRFASIATSMRRQ
jgi:hypothetical protein